MNSSISAIPLVNQTCSIERFRGKGGWTFVLLPEIPPDPHAHFGWVRVQGSIDGIAISQYHLMPSGNGQLFLPVKAAIRKQLKKSAGDEIRVILYLDKSPVEFPAEIRECPEDVPGALDAVNRLTTSEQKAHIDHVLAAVKDTTNTERIAALIRQVLK